MMDDNKRDTGTDESISDDPLYKTMERQRQRLRVFIWQSHETTIIGFGPNSRDARSLIKSSVRLTDQDLELLGNRHNCSTSAGKPVVFSNH